MKAVLVGAGFAGRAHAAALRACGVEITAVVTVLCMVFKPAWLDKHPLLKRTFLPGRLEMVLHTR